MRSAASNNQLPESILLIRGDFVEKSSEFILDNSIDLIFTDPSYGREWLSLYEDLAKVALKVLKDWWEFSNLRWSFYNLRCYSAYGKCGFDVLVAHCSKAFRTV